MSGLGSLIKGEAEPIAPAARNAGSNAAVETAALGAPAATVAAAQTPATGDKPKVKKEDVNAWKAMLKDPRVRAGFLQTAVNLFAGQNIGTAAGGGLAATGRAAELRLETEERERKAALEADELAMRKAESVARIGSLNRSNRGGSSKVKKAKLDDITKFVTTSLTTTTTGQFGEEIETTSIPPQELARLSMSLHQLSQNGGNWTRAFQSYLNNPELTMWRLDYANGLRDDPPPAPNATVTPTDTSTERVRETAETPAAAPVITDPLDPNYIAPEVLAKQAETKKAKENAAAATQAETDAANASAELADVSNAPLDEKKKLATWREGVNAKLMGGDLPGVNQTMARATYLTGLNLTSQQQQALYLLNPAVYGPLLDMAGYEEY